MDEGTTELLFLYGTLRRGASRDALGHYAGVEFVATARVRGVLYDFGDYPGLRLDAGAGWVRGELFRVTAAALASLDEWEGIDPAAPDAGEYRRVPATVERAGAAPETCWAYKVDAKKCASGKVIASGDWMARAALG